jgi:hypothetical protein
MDNRSQITCGLRQKIEKAIAAAGFEPGKKTAGHTAAAAAAPAIKKSYHSINDPNEETRVILESWDIPCVGDNTLAYTYTVWQATPLIRLCKNA